MRTKFFFTSVAVALVVASCGKVSIPVAQDTLSSFSISAIATKTYMKNGPDDIWWTGNDVLTVLPEEGGTGVVSEKVSTAAESYQFNVNGWSSSLTPKYAVFNGPDSSPSATISGITITSTLSSTQKIFHKNSFSKLCNLSAGILAGSDGNYATEMKNVCGLVKFTISRDNVSKVVLSDANGTAALAGDLSFEFQDGIPVVTGVENGQSAITVQYNNADFTKNNSYYICVNPSAEFVPKFTISFSDGKDDIEVTGKSSVRIPRAKFQDFGIIDNVRQTKVLESQYYINNDTNEGRSCVSGMATASTGSSDPFTIKMNNGETYTFTPTMAWRLLPSTAADSASSETKGVIAALAEGFISLPNIEGYSLSSVYIFTAATNKKAAITTTSTTIPSSATTIGIYEDHTFTVDGTASNYYLYVSNAFRISHMKLTYTEN